MVVSVQVTSYYHQDSSSPFVSSFCRRQSHQGIKSSQHDRRHPLNRSLRIRLVDGLPPCNLYLSISPCRADLIRFSRNSPSGVSQTICRNAAKSMLSLLSLHLVNVGLRRWSLRELQSIIHTLCMKRQCDIHHLYARTHHAHQPRQHGATWTLRLRLREHTFRLAKWIDTLYL